jgi:hypothetical protein
MSMSSSVILHLTIFNGVCVCVCVCAEVQVCKSEDNLRLSDLAASTSVH